MFEWNLNRPSADGVDIYGMQNRQLECCRSGLFLNFLDPFAILRPPSKRQTITLSSISEGVLIWPASSGR